MKPFFPSPGGLVTGLPVVAVLISPLIAETTFPYSAPAPSTLVVSEDFHLDQNLVFNVANGTTDISGCAVLDVASVIDDGIDTFNVTKVGNGALKLAAGNTYSGSTTIQRGILSIPADSALGDSTAPLALNGGCLLASTSFSMPRNVAFGTSGGSIRADGATALNLTGNVAWSSGMTSFFGSGGTTVLSGTTSGTGGDLMIGWATEFAPAGGIASHHTLSLRGSASLPAGGLWLDNFGVLELGNGNFTRALGSGPGQVRLETSAGAGFAAYGADRIVNIGGSGSSFVWGQTSPPFLSLTHSGFTTYGDLVLGSSTATHTVDFQNPLQLNNGQTKLRREIQVPDGPATVEARISGGISQSAPPQTTTTTLAFDADGALEITGPMSGSMSLEKTGTGTVILSGTNSFNGYSDVYEGTLRIASNAAWGSSHSFYVETDATLDASAMTAPAEVPSGYFASIYGSFLGDLQVSGYLEGNGFVDGNVHAEAGAYVLPDYDGQLHVTGDFTLDHSAEIEFYLASTTPLLDYNQMRVGGTVTLDGDLLLGSDPVLVENDSFILLLNDGTDPIHGTFHGLPEGGVIPIGDGLALQITYQANGDGGPVGNDVGFTVVPDTSSTDLALSVNAPLAVDLASSFTITYTIANLGPNDSSASSLEVELPPSATFNGSTPSGALVGNLLTIPVSALANGGNTAVTLNFTAPATSGSVFIAPWIYNGAGDANDTNDHAPSVTAVIPGGVPVIDSFSIDPENDTFTLGMKSITDVRYVLQQSSDLDHWNDLLEFLGNGELMEFQYPVNETKKFFRFSILPYDNVGNGTPE